MTRLRICGLSLIFLFCVLAPVPGAAQSISFTTLVSFDGNNGASPAAGLVQGSDSNFYGTTTIGGAYNFGTVFKITPSGQLATLYSFCSGGLPCADGANPYGALVQAADGNFYGTTDSGGANGVGGTVFKITSQGALTTLYSFCSEPNCADGGGPYAGLIQGSDGAFYGTTTAGGGTACVDCGTVFKITPQGTFMTLHSFDGSDGMIPYGGLIQATDGNFYGTTIGDAYGYGSVFKMTPAGELTTLHIFDQIDGYWPNAALVQASDGNFYGTTTEGGYPDNLGNVFQMTPDGTLTSLYNFEGPGAIPTAALVQASDGNLYSTTSNVGTTGAGTVFKITTAGVLTTLHVFHGRDGLDPYAGLVQAANGFFYGTTWSGGAYGDGTVFRLGVVRACTNCRP